VRKAPENAFHGDKKRKENGTFALHNGLVKITKSRFISGFFVSKND
jgi:hypothetical protein